MHLLHSLLAWLKPLDTPRRRRARPFLERLEARDVPTATLRRGNLNWSGMPPPQPVQTAPPLVRAARTPVSAARAVVPPQTVLAGDFNGDGRTDVARLSATGIWQVGTSDGTVFCLNHWGRWAGRAAWKGFLVGDFDGNGRADIAGLDRGGSWIVQMSTGTHFLPGRWGSGLPAGDVASLHVGDFNADGRDDVAGFHLDGSWQVGLSTGRGFDRTTWARWQPAGNWAWVGVGDFDGDGRGEVAGLDRRGGWTVGLSTGRGFNSAWWGRSAVSPAGAVVRVGDFDGNGASDVAALGAGGALVVGLSTRADFRQTPWATWAPAYNYVDVTTGDVTGDGRTDLVARTAGGHLVVGASTGARFLSAAWDRWTFAPASRLLVGDVNGDRWADVTTFTADGRWYAARSNSARFFTKLYGQWPLGVDAGGYGGEATPYTPDAPWSGSANRPLMQAQPQHLVAGMYFNSPGTYTSHVENFRGVLRAWVLEADLHGYRDEATFRQYVADRLNAFFPRLRPVLAGAYPGLTDSAYRLLLSMNLAHGYLDYATNAGRGLNVHQTLHLRHGDCSEVADVAAALARMQGVPARILGFVLNYPSENGLVQSSHQVVYVLGLWVDAEINTAFGLELGELARVAPTARLQSLFDARRIYGFYNWYLKPDVRAAQLARGTDGGILSFYYHYYFQGLSNGASVFVFAKR